MEVDGGGMLEMPPDFYLGISRDTIYGHELI